VRGDCLSNVHGERLTKTVHEHGAIARHDRVFRDTASIGIVSTENTECTEGQKADMNSLVLNPVILVFPVEILLSSPLRTTR
jgi:hypothetical protein